MKSFIPAALVLLASCASVPGPDATSRGAAPLVKSDERRVLEAWHESMRRTPPPKRGCFEVTHPSTTWREVPCKAAPQNAYVPRRDAGGAHSYYGKAASGLILAAGGI